MISCFRSVMCSCGTQPHRPHTTQLRTFMYVEQLGLMTVISDSVRTLLFVVPCTVQYIAWYSTQYFTEYSIVGSTVVCTCVCARTLRTAKSERTWMVNWSLIGGNAQCVACGEEPLTIYGLHSENPGRLWAVAMTACGCVCATAYRDRKSVV